MSLSLHFSKQYPNFYLALQVLDTITIYGLVLGCLTVLSKSLDQPVCTLGISLRLVLHIFLISNAVTIVERNFWFTVSTPKSVKFL